MFTKASKRLSSLLVALSVFLFFVRPLTAEAVEPGLVGRSIVLDAGHGGPDSGAQGVSGELEKEITLKVAKRLANYLEQSGAVVYFTRASDHDLATDGDRARKQRHRGDLKGRLAIVRHRNPSAFLSIHCNAVPSPIWHGAQTLYFTSNPEGKAFAQSIQTSFDEVLGKTNRSIQKNATLYLLKRIKGPAALAEIGFLSNPEEASKLMTADYQNRVSYALYIAVMKYFGSVPIPEHCVLVDE